MTCDLHVLSASVLVLCCALVKIFSSMCAILCAYLVSKQREEH